MPRFSVIIPIYNIEELLPKCVDSLLAQNYRDAEIILVDDGSPDTCGQICDRYAQQDSRIKVIHKPNGGVVSARQAGCEVATGDYILNVDGDDWVADDYFAKLDSIVEQYAPDCICFSAQYICGNEVQDRSLGFKSGLYSKEDIVSHIHPVLIEGENSRYFDSALWSKAFKRAIYADLHKKLDPRIKIGEDHAVTKAAIYQCETVYIYDACLYRYRLNPLSATQARKAFPWDGPELIGKYFKEHIPMNEHDFQEQVYRNIVHNLFNVAVSQFNRQESYQAICRDIDAHIKHPYYQNAIKHCKYKCVKGISAKMALQLRLYWLLKLKAVWR